MKLYLLSLLAVLALVSPSHQEGGFTEFSKAVKCLVCQAATDEMDQAVSKIDEDSTVDLPTYGLDREAKKISFVKSEMYLTELMETVCKKLDDYLKATYRVGNYLTLIKLSHNEDKDGKGELSDEVSQVEFVQDGDLNRSLPTLCFEILEDNEEAILEHYMKKEKPTDSIKEICHRKAEYCNANLDGAFGDLEETLRFKKSQ